MAGRLTALVMMVIGSAMFCEAVAPPCLLADDTLPPAVVHTCRKAPRSKLGLPPGSCDVNAAGDGCVANTCTGTYWESAEDGECVPDLVKICNGPTWLHQTSVTVAEYTKLCPLAPPCNCTSGFATGQTKDVLVWDVRGDNCPP